MAETWTTLTLATQLMGAVAGESNTGGTPSDRLLIAVNQAGASVWNAKLWRFRRSTAYGAPSFHYSEDPFNAPSTSTATPTWPSTFNEGWYLAALWFSLEAYGQHERAESARAAYETWLKRAEETDEGLLGSETPPTASGSTVNGITENVRAGLALPRGHDVVSQIEVIVRECGITLWNAYDWRFRARQGTLSITAATATVAAPSDFGELYQRWLRDYDDNATLRFTESVTAYQAVADTYDSDDTGEPEIACFVRDYTASTWTWKIIFSPTSDAAYSYTYWYVVTDPWTSDSLADTASPVWPATFNAGWRLLSRMQVAQAFNSKTYESDRKAWMDWLGKQVAENDETITTGSSEYIEDGYGDTLLTTSGSLHQRATVHLPGMG